MFENKRVHLFRSDEVKAGVDYLQDCFESFFQQLSSTGSDNATGRNVSSMPFVKVNMADKRDKYYFQSVKY